MRRSQIVALCLAVGALIAAAITPGVIGSGSTPKFPDSAFDVPPGYVIDRQVIDTSGPAPSVFTIAHRPVREIKPGEPGYVPEPKKGEPGWEPSGDGR